MKSSFLLAWQRATLFSGWCFLSSRRLLYLTFSGRAIIDSAAQSIILTPRSQGSVEQSGADVILWPLSSRIHKMMMSYSDSQISSLVKQSINKHKTHSTYHQILSLQICRKKSKDRLLVTYNGGSRNLQEYVSTECSMRAHAKGHTKFWQARRADRDQRVCVLYPLHEQRGCFGKKWAREKQVFAPLTSGDGRSEKRLMWQRWIFGWYDKFHVDYSI